MMNNAMVGAGRPAAYRFRIEHRSGSGTTVTFSDHLLPSSPFAMREGRMGIPPLRADLEWYGKRTRGICLEEVDYIISTGRRLPPKELTAPCGLRRVRS